MCLNFLTFLELYMKNTFISACKRFLVIMGKCSWTSAKIRVNQSKFDFYWIFFIFYFTFLYLSNTEKSDNSLCNLVSMTSFWNLGSIKWYVRSVKNRELLYKWIKCFHSWPNTECHQLILYMQLKKKMKQKSNFNYIK